jgi:hypothetical protein
LWCRHFNRIGKESAGAVSTGQKYNWNPIRTGNHTAFSKGGSTQFFNEFYGFKIKSDCPDFYCGSGNKLNTVPTIFTGWIRVSVAQRLPVLSAKT